MIGVADIDVEKLKEKLYPVAKALFIISEILVDVSKQHISTEDAIKKIRFYVSDTDVIGSRYRLDKLIEDCMNHIDFCAIEEYKKDILERNRGVFYAPKNMDELMQYKADINRIAKARSNVKKYIKEK